MPDLPTTAMILGAGRGTRLGARSLTVPKILVDVAGRPLLRRQIDYLETEGFTRVVVNSHHLADQVTTFAEGYTGSVELIVVREGDLLGTAGGVRNALDRLGGRPFLVLYGDVLVDESLAGLRAAHAKGGARATITVYESADVRDKGTVRLDTGGGVTAFVEKGDPPPGPGLINAGVYVIDPELVSALPLGVELDFGYDVFPAALERGVPIASFRLDRPVIDIGTPSGLERAESLVTRSDDDSGAR